MTNTRTTKRIALCCSAILSATVAAQQPPFAGGLQGERTAPPLLVQKKLQRDGTTTGMHEWARQANRAVHERLPRPVFATVSATGANIVFFDANAQPIPIPSGGIVGLRSRFRYVVALENLGPRPDMRFYGSIEVVLGPWLPPMVSGPEAPVAIAFNDQDVRALSNGGMITKVIVLENPAMALPVVGSPTEPLIFDVLDEKSALHEAKLRGRIFMIVRIGDRQLNRKELVGLAAEQSLFLPSDAGLAAAKKGSKLSLSHFKMVAGGSQLGGNEEILQASYSTESGGLPPGYSAPPCGPNCPANHGAPCHLCGRGCDGWPPFAPLPPAPGRPAFVPYVDRYDDEWVCDGADRSPKAMVDNYNRIINVDPGDTIGVYRDHDGRKRFAESNLACVYSPRYVEIRAVQNVEAYERWLNDQRLRQSEGGLQVAGVKRVEVRDRAESAEGLQARMRASGLVANSWAGEFSEVRILEGLEQAVGHHVDKNFQFSLWLKNHEQLFVRRHIEFAKTLSLTQYPVVVSSGMGHGQVLMSEGQKEIRKIDIKPGRPARLIVEKTVDRPAAKPGEVVKFVLRYTNVGDEPMTNVAVIDSLPARLEYVQGSAKSSADAVFTAEENEAGSVMLRWEIRNLMKGKDSGIIEFQARLR
jgi:uncharacterized repeat protein (TIGR01451 family)